MHIDGKTEVVGIIGYPIDYTLSPAIHNAAFRSLGMNWLYIPLRVVPGEVEGALKGLRALGLRGANVTIPHKTTTTNFLDELRGDAKLLKTVNTISREGGELVGYNTDSEGFEAFLKESNIDVKGRSATIIGAGGAARAVALALSRLGVARMFVMNRTAERTAELKALLKRAISYSEIFERTFDYEGATVIKESSLIVNCTPRGNTAEDLPPLDLEDFQPGQWVVDLKYGEPGAFLNEASARGARTANGEGMLLHQAAASFRIWTGRDAPLQVMLEAMQAMTSE